MSEQKDIYDTIMHCVDNNVGEISFLDAPGGTGKTFVIKLILALREISGKHYL